MKDIINITKENIKQINANDLIAIEPTKNSEI